MTKLILKDGHTLVLSVVGDIDRYETHGTMQRTLALERNLRSLIQNFYPSALLKIQSLEPMVLPLAFKGCTKAKAKFIIEVTDKDFEEEFVQDDIEDLEGHMRLSGFLIDR